MWGKMNSIGKWAQALTISLALGLVDQINNGVALVEYDIGGGPQYIEVEIKESMCTPREGEWVLFNRKGIMQCNVVRHRDVESR